ncbi:MAG TPA: phytanoyl-CoA dioxygenase family protein [Caldilineaceae bacterium]|nr:phytanoyl-CoA dioxygenase family protein [Caldilineaceae bacterium]
MTTQTLPPLYYGGRQLITEPTHHGELRPSNDILDNPEALRARMAEDGYLYLPGLLDVDAVLAARRSVLERLQAEGALHPDYPLMEGVAAPDVHFTFRPDLANGNPVIHRLLYTGPLMDFFARFLGGPVLHYDFTWLRAKAPGPNTATSPHCDIVFMSRGTKQLYTAWVPLDDVPYELGGLMILEGSHRKVEHLGEYWEFDVDSYCIDGKNDKAHEQWSWAATGGSFSKDAIGVRQQIGGRWLSTEYKLGDALIFGMFTLHGSLDNRTNRIRLSTDSRYQLAGEAVDERWVGEHPIAHGPEAKIGMIC